MVDIPPRPGHNSFRRSMPGPVNYPISTPSRASSDFREACPVTKHVASSSSGCPVSNSSRPSPSKPVVEESDSGIDIPIAALPDVSRDKNPSYDKFDEEALYTNLRDRVAYLTKFVNFTEQDVEALNDLAPIVVPLVPQVVDNVYHHLFQFDVTKQVFMPRREDGETRILSDLHQLTTDAPGVEVRKKTFGVYLRKLVTSNYDDFATWQYFDNVGLMHTGQQALKHRKVMGKAPFRVDLMHLSLLLAWTVDMLTPIILSHPDFPLSQRIDMLRALQKVIWIQNDLFTRHYVVRSSEVDSLRSIREASSMTSLPKSGPDTTHQPNGHHANSFPLATRRVF